MITTQYKRTEDREEFVEDLLRGALPDSDSIERFFTDEAEREDFTSWWRVSTEPFRALTLTVEGRELVRAAVDPPYENVIVYYSLNNSNTNGCVNPHMVLVNLNRDSRGRFSKSRLSVQKRVCDVFGLSVEEIRARLASAVELSRKSESELRLIDRAAADREVQLNSAPRLTGSSELQELAELRRELAEMRAAVEGVAGVHSVTPETTSKKKRDK
jgi:hypothetical protein